MKDLGSLYSLRDLNISGNNFVSLPDTIGQLSKLETLCLEKCHRLQSLPKLPLGLIFVQTDDCTSLKTISSLLEITSPAIGLQFLNCFNLVKTQGSDKESLAIMLLKHWLQTSVRSSHDPFSRELSPSFEFYIHLPGSEIPKIFNYQNEGNEINVRLPDGWFNNEFIGFALCGVFSPGDHSDGSMATAGFAPRVAYSFHAPVSTIKSDHLWLAYLSAYSYRIGLSDPHKGHVVCFYIANGEGFSVKRCGIRPLYKHDAAYLQDLSATEVGIPKVQKLYWGFCYTVTRINLLYALNCSRMEENYLVGLGEPHSFDEQLYLRCESEFTSHMPCN